MKDFELYSFKQKLDDIGCGMCLAKWTQVTMHLHNGMTHSCHHPVAHKIPLREIKNNPTALHNTNFKKKIRRKMISGEKPEECEYCWNVEKTSNSFSDRIFKSSEPWSEPYLEEIKNLKWNHNYNPKYVEVSFSNVCNFKCAYCSPICSSKWTEEINKYGGYILKDLNYNNLEYLEETDQLPYNHTEYNPYVESFWNWWPELYRDLNTFRITGGEPLLCKDTWKILDFISETDEPNRNLNISINTNLGVPKELIIDLVEKAKKIIDENRVHEFIIFTSCEAYGEQSEYVRYGMNFDLFFENLEYILENLPKVNIVMMATFNALSVFSYDKLIDKVFEIKKKYHSENRYWPPALQLDTSYLMWPNFLSVKILEDEQKELILKSAKKVFYYATKEFSFKHYGFSNTEVQKIKRIYDYSISKDDFDVDINRKNFVDFVDEYDIRRGTNFFKTFPQMNNLYNNVKNK
jgi:organic radical activating enzyme